ncbi:MAG TPA: hypothetical protein VEG39_10670 [Clostridia bacterium]|nr:hypothetical protein [Clostridia bacterium]
MEKNLNVYIKRLMELDSRAVEFKDERNAELSKLEEDSRNTLRSIENILEEAALMAKQEHDRIMEAAKLQIKEMDEAADRKLKELQAYYEGFRESAARDIWKLLLDIER